MDLGLKNSRALVTAASKGLGRACAAALAAEGARVFIVSRDDARLADTEREIGAAGHLAVDLAQPGSPEKAVEAALTALGGLDVLVCNAGGPPPGTFESTPVDAWETGYHLTLMSTVRLTRAALPALKESGRGRIVNITSISVRQPIPNIVLSNAFRSGVTAMAKTLAAEVAPFGVTVNNLAPGTILTDRVRELYGGSVDGLVRSIPAGRIGDPAEFGATCAFLCSVQAGYITGQTIGVDGGALRGVH
ncbi:MAG TPA: SDR family oxidoreductase [Candidatus Dormibacteraeota bacterium]|nr:SDR family oxidoreductase [Candidatus Dormibacteraeota bacterium]